jgi:SAM-dependent methyltransferase
MGADLGVRADRSVRMTKVFGEVAALYDEARPGYPPELAPALLDYRGAAFGSVVDVGAGTGIGTAALLELGAPITCVEPDPRMAAVLGEKFPQVKVVAATFEQWAPPAGGVDLLASATAWHWTDPETRNQRAFDALAPGGVLAVFHNRYDYRDGEVSRALGEVLNEVDPTVEPRSPHWSYEDVRAAGLLADVQELEWHRYPELPTERYLALMQTFSPFRGHSPQVQRATLDGLGAVLERFGGAVTMDIRTMLTLARRD